MTAKSPRSEYLVISRGQWDKEASKEDIQASIDRFYVWLERAIEAGKMKIGSRLDTHRAVVSKAGVVMDGPFSEAKEIVGGYWFIVADSLAEAAAIAAENPCLKFGLQLEIRPLDPERGSAYSVTNETPNRTQSAAR